MNTRGILDCNRIRNITRSTKTIVQLTLSLLTRLLSSLLTVLFSYLLRRSFVFKYIDTRLSLRKLARIIRTRYMYISEDGEGCNGSSKGNEKRNDTLLIAWL